MTEIKYINGFVKERNDRKKKHINSYMPIDFRFQNHIP